MDEQQYSVLASRRQSYDTLLWQTPALSIAAQGLLLSAALDDQGTTMISIGMAIAALLVGMATLQFFARMRFMEVYDSELLADYERSRGWSVIHGRRAPFDKVPQRFLAKFVTYKIWFWLLVILIMVSASAVISIVLEMPAV